MNTSLQTPPARHWGRFSFHYLEMVIAMFVPVVPLFPLLWTGVINGMDLMLAAHVAMFPLMLAAMFRRLDEYAHAHH